MTTNLQDISGNRNGSGGVLVSAIVSTYHAERFLRGKLEDLEAQTIASDLEIIVIDSGSPQNERGIVEEFQRRYRNIRYLRTERRETVYQAWNRGIREARGEFVTNANTDDRLRRDCYEVLVRALREHPACVLAYPDMRITRQENATFENHQSYGFKDWPDFDRLSLLELCCIGPFPLWRRSLHDEIGYFDERFRCIGDYEFWLRAALRHDFIHVPQFLGLYWLNEQTVSRKGELPALEYLQVQKEYRPRYAAVTPPPQVLAPQEEQSYREIVSRAAGKDSAGALADLERFAKRHPRWPRVHHDLADLYCRKGEIGQAKACFERAAILDPASPFHQKRLQAFLRTGLHQSLQQYMAQAVAEPEDVERRLSLGMICLLMEEPDAAAGHYRRALEIDPECAPALANLAALGTPPRAAAPAAMPALTSIVMLTFNELDCTRECLESIERNTPEAYEMILVDNGSTDGSVEWLRDFCARRQHFTLIENGENLGFAAGCNAGMRRALGGRILLLNNDVVVTPGWLSGLSTALEREPRAAIAGPMTNNIAGPQRVPGTNYSNIGELEEYARSFRIANAGRRIPVDRVVGFCMLFTRELLEEIGEIDTRFGSGNFEDDDFCLRAALAGYRCVIAGDVFIHHYGSRSFTGNGIDHAAAMCRNRSRFDEKWNLSGMDEALARKVLAHNAASRGSALARQGRLNEAVDLLLQQGIGCRPISPAPYLALAELYAEAGKWDTSLEVLQRVPQGADGEKLLLTGLSLRGAARPAQALELADDLLRRDLYSRDGLYLKGVLLADRGETKEAEELLHKSLLADPGFGPAFTALAGLAWERGERDQGLGLAELGFVLAPLDMKALDRFHGYATVCDVLPREEQRVREARALHPDHKGLAYGLIEVLLRQGAYREALDEIEQSAVSFGLDDGAIDAALEIRRLAGDPAPPRRGSGSVSLCVIVKDEAKHLPAALLSVRGFADEIVVVDTGSTDRTGDIARIFGSRLFSFPWNGSFADARNFSLSKAQGDWILVLDADEVLSPRDLPPLSSMLQRSSDPVAYSFTTRNYTEEIARKNWSANVHEYAEERGRGWTPSEKVRLFPNDERIRFEGAVHELLEGSLISCGIRIHACDVPVHHYGKLDVARCAEKQETYFALGMKKLAESGGSVESIMELARQATELHRFREAEELWHRVLESCPEDAEPYFNLGYLFLALGDYPKARAYAERAAELAPEMKEAAFNLGKSELFLGQTLRAFARCEEMLLKWPDYPPALSLLCTTLLITGQTADAEELLEKLRAMGFDCRDFLAEYAEGLERGERGHLAAPLQAAAARIAGAGAMPPAAKPDERRDCHAL